MKKIEFLNVVMSKNNPMRAASYIPLPEEIELKEACVNVQNVNQECFKWAVLSVLVHYKGYKINNLNFVSTYEKYVKEFDLKFGDLTFPIPPGEIFKFEILNNISINLYILKKENKKFQVYPIHLSTQMQPEIMYLRQCWARD